VTRLLVACVGNPLRGDDGFGPAVAARLGALPPGVDVVETGIGGVALLHELMGGCDGLVLVDASDLGAAPGTVRVLEPQVAPAVHVPDVHLANPDRVLSLAQALGCLPARVVPSTSRSPRSVRRSARGWTATAAPGSVGGR
jgi:hydrogenase maturation protease